MRQEATDWVPAVTAGIGAAAALAGQVLAGLFQGRNQQRAEQRQRRDRAAQTGGTAAAVHEDLEPLILAARLTRDTFEQELQAIDRRLLPVREELWFLHAGHPSEQVRQAAREAVIQLGLSFERTAAYVRASYTDRDDTEVRNMRNLALDSHREAKTAVETLLHAINQT